MSDEIRTAYELGRTREALRQLVQEYAVLLDDLEERAPVHPTCPVCSSGLGNPLRAPCAFHRAEQLLAEAGESLRKEAV